MNLSDLASKSNWPLAPRYCHVSDTLHGNRLSPVAPTTTPECVAEPSVARGALRRPRPHVSSRGGRPSANAIIPSPYGLAANLLIADLGNQNKFVSQKHFSRTPISATPTSSIKRQPKPAGSHDATVSPVPLLGQKWVSIPQISASQDPNTLSPLRSIARGAWAFSDVAVAFANWPSTAQNRSTCLSIRSRLLTADTNSSYTSNDIGVDRLAGHRQRVANHHQIGVGRA